MKVLYTEQAIMKAFLILTRATQSLVIPSVSQSRLVISESLLTVS